MSEPANPTIRTADDDRVARARQRVAAIKGFYIHFTVFALVIAGLAFVNWLSGDVWWVQWVLLGWGVGVAAHGIGLSMGASHRIADWEKRKVEELLRAEDQTRA